MKTSNKPRQTKPPQSDGFDPIADSASAAHPPANNHETEPPAANEREPTPDLHQTVQLVAPMGHCEGGYAAKSIEFRGMTRRQSAAAKRLFLSLGRENERIQMIGIGHPDGKVVNSYGDAVRWVFERLADAFEAETGEDITKGLDF